MYWFYISFWKLKNTSFRLWLFAVLAGMCPQAYELAAAKYTIFSPNTQWRMKSRGKWYVVRPPICHEAVKLLDNVIVSHTTRHIHKNYSLM